MSTARTRLALLAAVAALGAGAVPFAAATVTPPPTQTTPTPPAQTTPPAQSPDSTTAPRFVGGKGRTVTLTAASSIKVLRKGVVQIVKRRPGKAPEITVARVGTTIKLANGKRYLVTARGVTLLKRK